MSKNLITRFAAIEEKLDTVLFRRPDDEEEGSNATKAAAGAVVAGGGLYAGTVANRAIRPMVADRKGGLRATVAGFTGKSPLTQTAAATGSVLKSNPLQAAKAAGATVAGDAKAAVDALRGSAAGKGFIRARQQGATIPGALRRGVGSTLRGVTRGRFGFSAAERIISLAAKCEATDAA